MAHSLEHPVVDSDDAGIQDLMQAAVIGSPVFGVQIHSEKTIHAPDSLDTRDASLIGSGSSRLAVDAFDFRADDHPPVFRVPGPAFSHGVFLRLEHLAARDLSRIRPQFAHVAHDQLSRESEHLFDVWRDINRAAASAVGKQKQVLGTEHHCVVQPACSLQFLSRVIEVLFQYLVFTDNVPNLFLCILHETSPKQPCVLFTIHTIVS